MQWNINVNILDKKDERNQMDSRTQKIKNKLTMLWLERINKKTTNNSSQYKT